MILAANLFLAVSPVFAPALRVGSQWEYELRSQYRVSTLNDEPIDVETLRFQVTKIENETVSIRLTQKLRETLIGSNRVPAQPSDGLIFELQWGGIQPLNWNALIPDRASRWVVWSILTASQAEPPATQEVKDALGRTLASIAIKTESRNWQFDLSEPGTDNEMRAIFRPAKDAQVPDSLQFESANLRTPGGNVASTWTATLKLKSFKL